jgi:CDP-diacylglycerol--serine O-phosphatidyltransferase
LTYLLLWIEEKGFPESRWRFLLPGLLVFLSVMMISEVKYPSFKALDFRARRTFAKMVVIVVAVGFFVILWEKVLPIAAPTVFSAYLIYGFVRPWLPRKTRREIEEEDDEDEEPDPATPGAR